MKNMKVTQWDGRVLFMINTENAGGCACVYNTRCDSDSASPLRERPGPFSNKQAVVERLIIYNGVNHNKQTLASVLLSLYRDAKLTENG